MNAAEDEATQDLSKPGVGQVYVVVSLAAMLGEDSSKTMRMWGKI